VARRSNAHTHMWRHLWLSFPFLSLTLYQGNFPTTFPAPGKSIRWQMKMIFWHRFCRCDHHFVVKAANVDYDYDFPKCSHIIMVYYYNSGKLFFIYLISLFYLFSFLVFFRILERFYNILKTFT